MGTLIIKIDLGIWMDFYPTTNVFFKKKLVFYSIDMGPVDKGLPCRSARLKFSLKPSIKKRFRTLIDVTPWIGPRFSSNVDAHTIPVLISMADGFLSRRPD